MLYAPSWSKITDDDDDFRWNRKRFSFLFWVEWRMPLHANSLKKNERSENFYQFQLCSDFVEARYWCEKKKMKLISYDFLNFKSKKLLSDKLSNIILNDWPNTWEIGKIHWKVVQGVIFKK